MKHVWNSEFVRDRHQKAIDSQTFPTKPDYNKSHRPLPKMDLLFDFWDILDYVMLMESIAFFTSDFFGPQPNEIEQTNSANMAECGLMNNNYRGSRRDSRT